MPRARFLLIALIALAALVATPRAGRASLALPTVTSDMVDADGTSVAGATVAAGTQVRAAATVAGAAGAPSGSVTFAEYDGSDCGGASTDAWTAALATALQPQSHTIDISNAGGWDSATAWNANGVDQFQTNWFGGLFAGTDNAFFSASSMAWRFAGLPPHPQVTSEHPGRRRMDVEDGAGDGHAERGRLRGREPDGVSRALQHARRALGDAAVVRGARPVRHERRRGVRAGP
jgi:hypothetical protein